MGKAAAVRAQVDVLSAWISELSEHFDVDRGRIVPFDYSPDLRAALDLHGISDPHTAWNVFCERADALTGLLDRLSASSPSIRSGSR